MTASPDASVSTPSGQRAVWLVALAGAVFIIWQYAAGASLWIDELALARNVIDRSWGELLSQPLAYAQVAPLGFLALEKLAATIFGDSERALRAVPFVCALGGLLVFTVVTLRVLGARGAIVAVAVVALSSRLIWNGAQAKQYAGDVFVTATLLWLVLKSDEGLSPRRALLTAALGVLAAFLSQPGGFVLTAGAAALLLAARQQAVAPARRRLTLVAGAWLLGAASAALLAKARVSPDTMALMRDYWAPGFAPMPPQSLGDLLWPWRAVRGLFGTALSIPGIEAYALFSLLGLVLLLWRHRLGIVAAGAIVLAMGAAAARLFPFLDRPAVFAIPLLALGCGAAVDAITNLVAPRSQLLAWAIPLVLVAAPARRIVRRPPVYRVQETRPVLAWVGRERRAGDATYVFYGAWQAMAHYGAKMGIAANDAVWGKCHRGDPRAYFRELDALRGKPRVWVIFTHAEPRFAERAAILGYLDSIGTRRDSMSVPDPYLPSVTSADAHLYDLSDAQRLGSTNAEQAPVPSGAEQAVSRRECRGPMIQ